MTGERWQEIRTVLEAALPMDSEKRRAYLDQACASDQSLRDEVESLLAADKQAQTGFLQSRPWRYDWKKVRGSGTMKFNRCSVLEAWAKSTGRATYACGAMSPSKYCPLLFRLILSACGASNRKPWQTSASSLSPEGFSGYTARKSSNRPQRLGWTDHAQRCEDE